MLKSNLFHDFTETSCSLSYLFWYFGDLISLMPLTLKPLNPPHRSYLISFIFVRVSSGKSELRSRNRAEKRQREMPKKREDAIDGQTGIDGIIEEWNGQRPAVWQSSCSHNTPRVIAPEYLLSLHPRSSFLDALIPPIRGQKGDEAARLRARAWQISLHRRHSRLGDHLSNAENWSKDMVPIAFLNHWIYEAIYRV